MPYFSSGKSMLIKEANAESLNENSKINNPDKVLVALKKTLTYEPIGIAIPANDFLFLDLLQNCITGMVNSGDLRTLSDRWFKDGAWVSQLR